MQPVLCTLTSKSLELLSPAVKICKCGLAQLYAQKAKIQKQAPPTSLHVASLKISVLKCCFYTDFKTEANLR